MIEPKKYQVVKLLLNKYDVLEGSDRLWELLNTGWEIERADSFGGGGGWNRITGVLVYILSYQDVKKIN